MNQHDLYYYAAPVTEFIPIARREDGELLADQLSGTHKDIYRRDAEDSLYRSWKNSLPALAEVLALGYATRGRIVVLEYCLRTKGRIDAVLCGKMKPYSKRLPGEYPSLSLVELKQWGDIKYRPSGEDGMLEAFWGGEWHSKKHPSVQVLEYREAIRELVKSRISSNEEILFHAYGYLHNTEWQDGDEYDVFRGPKFAQSVSDARLYTAKAKQAFGERLRADTHRRNGNSAFDILQRL